LVLTKTHINHIFFGSFITTDYDPICLNSKKSTIFCKCEYVYKASRTHKSRYTPTKFRLEETINMASVSSNIDLKNCVSDFLAHVLVILLQEDKV